MDNNKKVFIVGFTTQFDNCTSYSWGDPFNPGDFDIGFFNIETLTKNLSSLSKGYLKKLGDLVREVQAKKYFEIYCIYSDSNTGLDSDLNFEKDITAEIFSWLPVFPVIRSVHPFKNVEALNSQGQDIRKFYSEYQFEYDYECVSNFAISNEKPNGLNYRDRYKITSIKIDNVLLQSNLGRPICFDLKWSVNLMEEGFGHIDTIISSKAPIHFLPLTPKIDDLIEFLLAEVFDSAEPAWTKDIVLPKEEEILIEVSELNNEISIRQAEIINKNKELIKYKKLKKVLYENGKSLEKSVTEIFKELGLEILKPENPAIEDRYFEIGDVRIYLEIRGKEKENFNEKDLNQLIQRIADKNTHLSYPLRGIFVFNHQRLQFPNRRTIPFEKNIAQKAEAFGICLLDTVTLFEIYRLKENFAEYDFKDKLLKTPGIFSLEKKDKNK